MANSIPNAELFGTSQAAQYLGVSTKTLYNWLKGEACPLTYTRTHTGRIRFRRSDLDAYLAENAQVRA